ncbi:uncharacterized protein TrAtP1_001245 [Trichoderma atroviride]|uniref:Uncharacterized protein n=1 Tax=Hypocrea atroviridis (strain ATCC 20476 / IMI 206040) TaxID=452589 RepID=G9P2H4_HYPAI|nr:uncharacterized protein TRIATDRAFT_320752 [Trichoderma atroviride IMI 206040]EHK43492.1 hypothetical protein TRIATDRAFT_320752 [Trichoderma atroviride IMI 206040]UKZ59957.1 hypothetical protein TrAtP1_001245 [Trichoderma atroviride]
MLHYSTLPSRRNPTPLGVAFPGSHSFGHKHPSPFNFNRSGIPSQPQSCPSEAIRPAETEPGHDDDGVESCKGSKPNPTAIDTEEEDILEFDPADSETWGIKSLPYWHQSAMLPGTGKGGLHNTR